MSRRSAQPRMARRYGEKSSCPRLIKKEPDKNDDTGKI